MASIALKSFAGGCRSAATAFDRHSTATVTKPASRSIPDRIKSSKSSARLAGRNLGGCPAAGSAAETLSKGGVETVLFERKLDNCKPCGVAIPLCMVGEFDLPLDIIDRRVTKMKMVSPTNFLSESITFVEAESARA